MRARSISGRLVAVAAILVLGTGLASVAGTGQLASATSSRVSSMVKAPVFTLPLTEVGEVNLSTVGAKSSGAAKGIGSFRGGPLPRG